ncbi:MAG: 4-hydroxy-3-methylbut-2-enyl diphosphate reductase [bacterium]
MTSRKLVLISPHGFCAGVERAVQIAEALLESTPKPVYCLKEIVHNRQIIDSLTSKGMVFVHDIHDAPRGATVLFSAHGIPPSTREAAQALGLHTVDATCPFVTKVHHEVLRYAAQGFSILLIGHHQHDEIIGVAGEAPDRVTVIANGEDARAVTVPDPEKVAVLTQTTLNGDDVASVMAILRSRFPSLQTPPSDDICYATRNRQQAVRLFAKKADAIIVLGAENSSNSNRLVEVARAEGCSAFLVSTFEKLEAIPLDEIRTLGITAGASTPESFVNAAIERLKARGFEAVEELSLIHEDIHFPVPTVN